MASSHDGAAALEASSFHPGVLTKTITRSPVVRWILLACLRDQHHQDLVFISETYLELRAISDKGSLTTLARKEDFDARICAAKVLNIKNEARVPHDTVRIKDEDSEMIDDGISRQMIVLTLSSDRLVFIRLVSDGSAGQLHFDCRCDAIPSFESVLFQPVQHLSVDPHSRAIAIAANEREIVLYSIEPGDWSGSASHHDMKSALTYTQRPLQVTGSIVLMDFLMPPSDDRDRIILLLIVMVDCRAKATWIEWYHGSNLTEARIHPGYPLGIALSIPGLLVPLRNTEFLVISGTQIERYKDILSGSLTRHYHGISYHGSKPQPLSPGFSSNRPAWIGFSKIDGSSSNIADFVYLIREDGILALCRADGGGTHVRYIDSIQCHASIAFAVVESSNDAHILAIAGEMSDGYIAAIGPWSADFDLDGFASEDDRVLEIIEILPNWASVTDMIATNLPSRRSKMSTDGLFITSRRQPFGGITQLRHGLEARLSLYFELPGLQSVDEVWAVSLSSSDVLLVILSSPIGTRVLSFPSAMDMEDVNELTDSDTALDMLSPTLAAGATSQDSILQITGNRIIITAAQPGKLGTFAAREVGPLATITAAYIDHQGMLGATVERSEVADVIFSLVLYRFCEPSQQSGNERPWRIERLNAIDYVHQPSCIYMTNCRGNYLMVATSQEVIDIYGVDRDGDLEKLATQQIPDSDDSPSICDYMGVLQSPICQSTFLVICGLRDGRIYSFIANRDAKTAEFRIFDEDIVYFSQTSVRLEQSGSAISELYAINETDICELSWSGGSSASLKITSIWITDKERPSLRQAPIRTCARVFSPASSTGTEPTIPLVMISGAEFLHVDLARTCTVVPRVVSVSGTPSRVLYSEQHSALVVASLNYGVKAKSAAVDQEGGTRQIWPTVQFIPMRSSEAVPSFTYKMQPGERVYAMLEWSYRHDASKLYHFVLIGGSYTKSSGRQKGRITILQPLRKGREIYDVHEGRSSLDEPVYALALWDELTYIACVGRHVHVGRFSPDKVKWERYCKPLKISSVGINITIMQPFIYISTSQDSLVVLTLTNEGLEDTSDALKLHFNCAGPQAAALLSHVELKSNRSREFVGQTVLATTKYGQIIGFRHRRLRDAESGDSIDVLFEAQLPRSLTRVRGCHVRPRWGPRSPEGIIVDNLIGCATDGALVGIALLSEDLYRRFSWLQRLCEWSEQVCPHLPEYRRYSIADTISLWDEQAIPIGLAINPSEPSSIAASGKKESRHLDGDILARLLELGGAEKLRSILAETAQREDRVGAWLREHWEEENAAVEETILLLQRALDCWL